MAIDSSNFMSQTVGCSETSVNTDQTAWRQIVGDGSPIVSAVKISFFTTESEILLEDTLSGF